MLAAAAILSLVVDLSLGRLYVYPGYDNGAGVRGGIELTHDLRSDVSLSLTGRAGATYAGDWRPVFEASAGVSWRQALEAHAGIRHDDRLRREGALADFKRSDRPDVFRDDYTAASKTRVLRRRSGRLRTRAAGGEPAAVRSGRRRRGAHPRSIK